MGASEASSASNKPRNQYAAQVCRAERYLTMFKRIYADNYLCFVNFEFKPGRVNLLIGDNGSGKSALFSLLLCMRYLVMNPQPVSSVFGSKTLTRWETVRNTQRFEFEVELRSGKIYRHLLEVEHHREQRTSRIKSETIELDHETLLRFDGLQLTDASGAKLPVPYNFTASALALDWSDPVLVELREFWVTMNLLKLDPSKLTSAAQGEDRRLLLDGGNFASWLRQLMQRNPDLTEASRDALREVIGGFKFVRFDTDDAQKKLWVRFETGSGSNAALFDVEFSQLSDGQRALLVLYSVIFAATHVGVMGFDEPDNFVSLREIQPFLAKLTQRATDAKWQAFLISHNPEVIDYLAADGCFIFERPDNGPARVRAVAFERESGLKASEQIALGWVDGS